MHRPLGVVLAEPQRSSPSGDRLPHRKPPMQAAWRRSEEHTSELQSRFDLVCRLPLVKTTTRSGGPVTRRASAGFPSARLDRAAAPQLYPPSLPDALPISEL